MSQTLASQPVPQQEPSILPTRQRANRKKHGGVSKRDGITKVTCECKLDQLLRWKSINPLQHEAGLLLYADYYRAGHYGLKSNFKTERLDGGKRNNEPIHGAMHAKEQYQLALASLGRISRRFVEHVCLYERDLSELVTEMQYSRKSYAGERLREALDDLCYFYGLK